MMLNQAVIINRLALIKQLFLQGIQQSKNSEPLSSFAILSFHDSIEMFLKLLAEKENVKSDGFGFINYWDSIPTLTLKESCRSLNTRRVNLKHKGILSSKTDIEASRVITTDFFVQNTFSHFGVEFEDISLLSLIQYQDVREYLSRAVEYFNTHNYKESIEHSSIAFFTLLHNYEDSKFDSRNSPLNFTEKLRRYSFSQSNISKEIRDLNNQLKECISDVSDVIKIIGLGIDFKKYMKFSITKPVMFLDQDYKYKILSGVESIYATHYNAQFCIDFVTESALSIQSFDFDIKEMNEIS